MPAIIPWVRGEPRKSRQRGSRRSGRRLRYAACASQTTTDASGSWASTPRTAALASSVMYLRLRSYSACPGLMSSGATTPATPSMSTEIRTRTSTYAIEADARAENS